MAQPGSAPQIARPQWPTRFLARESELDRLYRRLEAAAAGRGGLLIVEGPPGTGTTSLARQSAGRALQLGFEVAWGDGGEGTLDRPYGGLAEALETHALGLDPMTVQADLADDAGALTRLCPALAEHVPTLTPAVPLDATGGRIRLREGLVGWLTRMAARAPLLVVVDGLNDADSDLTGTLEHLARRLRRAPVLIIVVRTAGRRLSHALETIVLGGLDVGATAALLAEVTARPVLPPTVALIQQVGEGRPLASVLLLRHVIEERLLPGPGSTRFPGPDELPSTIADLVAWAVARLPREAVQALDVLACFPRGTYAHIIGAVAGLSRTRLLDALEGALASGLVVLDTESGRYRVAHPAIRASLLEALSPTLRGQLHRRVAETLEADAGQSRRERAAQLAHHWHASRSLPGAVRGLEFCLLATEQARAAQAPARAAELLKMAHDLAADDATRLDVRSRLAGVVVEAGDWRAALVHGRDLLSAGGPGVTVTVTDLLRAVRGDGMAPRDWPKAEELRAAAAERLRADRSSATDRLAAPRLELLGEHWQALKIEGVSTLVWGDLRPEAVAILTRDGSEADRAETMLRQRPRNQGATAITAQSATAWRRPAAVLRALAATTTDLVTRHGLFSGGGGWAAQYLATARRYGSRPDEAAAAIALARSNAALGEFNAADEMIALAADRLAAIGGRSALDDELLLAQLAVAYYRDADWGALLKSLAPGSARPAALALSAQRALAHVRLGNEAEARELIARLLSATAQLEPLTFWRDAALATTLAAAWELGSAEHSAVGRSLVVLTVEAGAGGQIEGTPELQQARLFALSGDLAAARSLFDTQRAKLDAAGLRPLRAMCDHDEAIALAATSAAGYSEATRLLESAAAQFAPLAMTGWAERSQKLLETGFEAASAPGAKLAFTYPRGLSRREADVVRLLADGASSDEVAAHLVLERSTVDRLTDSAIDKLGGERREGLAQLARRYGLGGV